VPLRTMPERRRPCRGAGLAAAARCFLALGLLALLPALASEPAPAPKPEPRADPIEKVRPHVYRIGKLTIDAKKRTVECPGEINIDHGDMIELIACLPTGKAYESLLVLDIKPMNLQVALVLLDLSPGRNPALDGTAAAGADERPPGDVARVFVRWETPPAEGRAEPEVHRERVEWLLRQVETGEPLEPTDWVFLGSRIVEGRLGAERSGTLITLYHDPMAIMETVHPRVISVPWSAVAEGRCPPAGTPVTLIIQASEKKAAEEPAGAESETQDEE